MYKPLQNGSGCRERGGANAEGSGPRSGLGSYGHALLYTVPRSTPACGRLAPWSPAEAPYLPVPEPHDDHEQEERAMSTPSIDSGADRAPEAAAQPRSAPRTPPPTVTELGGLAELTLGGIDGAVSDGFGTSGDTGSV